MKAWFLLIFLSVFFLSSQAQKPKVRLEAKKMSADIDESLKIKKNSNKAGNQIKEDEEKSSDKKTDIVSQKIKSVFIDFLEILDKESVSSNEYAKAVRFLENSLYNEASFETLKILATAYQEKKDFQNQIKVLNILSVNHSNKSESFYLLGMAYQDLYLKDKNGIDKTREYKNKAIESFNQALKVNKKYFLAYKSLMDLLMTKNVKTDEDIHTKESLSVAIEMLRNLRKNKHYIQVCKAYYDNQFLKQSRKACAVSVKKNRKDPISPLMLALSRNKKEETDKELLQVAEKFKKSFFVQYKTALYFMDKDSKVATTYFDRAYALQPENIKLNKIMAQFLFHQKEEEKSYKHFLKVCLFTDGKFLRAFRSAKSQLRSKNMKDMKKLLLKFQKGIDECFYSVRKKKRKKK